MYSNNTLTCFFCGRDLSMAMNVHYIVEGAICSICLSKMSQPTLPGTGDLIDEHFWELNE